MAATKSADHAYDAIRVQILDGTMAAGSRLVEADLAEALQTSRTPIREALRRLEAEGLIEVLPHRGARVTAWTEDDLRDMYDLRAVLEAMAAERAAARITVDDLEQLDQLCEEMDQCIAGNEAGGFDAAARERYSDLNTVYHDIIRNASGSTRLVAMIHAVVHVPLIVSTFYRYQPVDLARSASHHREIVSALRAGHAVWAGSILRAHVLSAKATLIPGDQY
jgi:DNA-binding GntR family transcriptional regulator